MDVRQVKQIANDNGWRFIKDSKEPILEFKQMEKRVKVNCKTRTVETELKHPRYGITRLRRERVDDNLLKLIFHYPRIHTDRGYYIPKNNY